MDERLVVITGGGGFVGQHLVRELARAWPDTRLVVWDRQSAAGPADSVAVDITEPASYVSHLARLQPTWVVHLAAVAQATAALRDPDYAQRVNVTATEQLLQAVAEQSPQARVLAISSAEIYGFASAEPVAELPLSAATPLNPYGKSKRDMEAMIAASFADRTVIARPFPHIGPGQREGFVTADFASQIAAIEAAYATAAAPPGRPIIKVGNLEAQRDFTDVRDVVRAYRLLMERGGVGEVYHVASGRAVAIREVLDRLLAMTAAEIRVEEEAERVRPADIPVLVGDAGKLREATGWKPEISLEQSLKDILAWWRAQQLSGAHR